MKRIKHYGHLSIKFLDVMFGAVIALGFNEWFRVPEHTYQSLLVPSVELGIFLFAYIILIDVWIKYDPVIRRFPPKHPHLLILDLFLIFSMFFLIHNSIFNFHNFLITSATLRIAVALLSQRAIMEYKPKGNYRGYFTGQRNAGVVESFSFAFLYLKFDSFPSVHTLLAVVVFVWLAFRVFDSIKVKDIIKADA